MQELSDGHYRTVINAITNGRVVPFLGAGANLCDRPDGAAFEEHGPYLPSGTELAGYLARNFNCLPAMILHALLNISRSWEGERERFIKLYDYSST